MDNEPWIIFTYKVYGLEKSNVYKNRFKPVVDMIKHKYRNKKKIIEPESVEELARVINDIMELNNKG